MQCCVLWSRNKNFQPKLRKSTSHKYKNIYLKSMKIYLPTQFAYKFVLKLCTLRCRRRNEKKIGKIKPHQKLIVCHITTGTHGWQNIYLFIFLVLYICFNDPITKKECISWPEKFSSHPENNNPNNTIAQKSY